MRQSVIGTFELRRDAVRARDAVQHLGYADTDLNLMPSKEIGPGGLTDEEADRYEEAIDTLFDHGADREAELYLDALRRGSTLLTVTIDEGRSRGDVEQILREHNASDVAGTTASRPAAGEGGKTVAEAADDRAKGR